MDKRENGSPLYLKKARRPINRNLPQTDKNPEKELDQQNFYGIQKNDPVSDVDEYLAESNLPASRERTVSYEPSYIDEREYEQEAYDLPEKLPPSWLSVKLLVFISIVAVFLGIVVGKLIFAESKVVRNGLQGVVVNNEIPRGRARCGVAERSQGCVLYLMNPQRQDMRAKDFYDLAAQMTGRQRFMIETGNMRYANSKIRPGDIVQLNIPPL